MRKFYQITVVAFCIIIFAGAGQAADFAVPNLFTPNTPARADEVNANFTAIENELNAQAQQLDQLFGANASRLVVSKAGGDFATVTAALATVTPSADNPVVIDVLPGTYVENVVLKSFVHLRGSGREVTTIQAADPALPVIALTDLVNVAISGLRITGGSHGIQNRSSSPRITRNLITANQNNGVDNQPTAPGQPGSSPHVVDNLITANIGNGMFNLDLSNPMLFINLINGNTLNGIRNENASPFILSNRIESNQEDGIDNDESSPQILASRVQGNGGNGILNINLSSPTIIGSRISLNDDFGILNQIQSSPTIIGSRISENGVVKHLDGIANEDLSNASITGSRISDNGRDGVRIDNSVVNLNGNRITGNAGIGVNIIAVPATGRIFVLHNRITGNGPPDVFVAPLAVGSIQPNISFNVYDAITGAANAVGAFNLTSAAFIIAPNTPAVPGTSVP